MRIVCAVLIAATTLLLTTRPATAFSQPVDDGHWLTFTILAAPVSAHRQAPADEYFGPNRLSNLGVRNALRDMNLEGTSPLALPIQRERIAAVEAALAIWADKYPADTWLPDSMLGFAKFLQSKQQPDTDDLAQGYLVFLEMRYPATRAGFEAREILARYHPLPAFDLSTAVGPGAHAGVVENLYPKLKNR